MIAEDDVALREFANIAAASSLPQLNVLFKTAVATLGFEHYAGGRLADADKPANMFLMDWPDAWAEEYSANGYAANDPTVPRALASSEPFTLHELLEAHPNDPVLAAAIAFGWKRAFIVPVHGPGQRRGIVCIASLWPARQAIDGDARTREQLQAVAIAAYRRGCLLHGGRLQGTPLPPRQREALTLASCGLTDQEIAAQLRISAHTAHSHIESAKRRLGARSRAQAIALAKERQLL